MTAGVLPIRVSRLRPMRDGAIVACLVLAIGLALGLLNTGVDAHAYWAAEPFDPYGGTRPAEQDAYFYAPPFAQILGPLHYIPWPWFIAIWTLLLTAAFIWQAWLWAGFLVLMVPVFAELTVGNIHLLLGAAIVAGFRWPWLWALPLLTKVTPGVGLLWFVLWPLCGLGFILLLIGIILVAATPSTPAYYAPYPYPYAAPGPAPAPAAGPACPTCGSPLTWIAQYGRWYCYRCQQYR